MEEMNDRQEEAVPPATEAPRPEPAPSTATSGATLSVVIGLVIGLAFVLGLAAGFFGRPLVFEDVPIEVVVTVVPNENEQQAQGGGQPAPQQGNGGQEADIMDLVMSDARHIQGDTAAPITIVEFSDFN